MRVVKKYDQYIKGTLLEIETEAFTKEVVKEYFETEALKEKWNTILESEYTEAKVTPLASKTPIRKWRPLIITLLASAASIILLLFAWFSYEAKPTTAHEKLLAAYISEPYQESISRKGPIEELQNKAIQFYNAKDYQKAASVFEEINRLDQSENWAFYLGLCNLYQQQADQAISYFDQALAYPNTIYPIETQWYLGLAYTMKNDLKNAKRYIEVVAAHSEYEEGWNVKEAKALLKAFEDY